MENGNIEPDPSKPVQQNSCRERQLFWIKVAYELKSLRGDGYRSVSKFI